ncbi:fructosamine kinase family protein [Aerosakkonemataceae cyanobacterium BLCC-F154]|uniref:Fructosamine kinase family protein n=1 Tax=Floridaenema fluviatile BLCC-F154 TaxID=3153640 RepID=A0ABV4YCL6_9CYAN
MWTTIAKHISEITGEKFLGENRRSVGGGCINQGYVISDSRSDRSYFVKINQADQVDMFAAEALGLKEMWSTKTIRVPEPICYGTANNSAYIVQEYLELGRNGGNNAWLEMGQKLAAMHKATSNQGFGWERNNTIGSTPQINTWKSDWAEFFAEHRISYQLKLAKRRGGQFSQGESLVKAIPELLANHHPQPSLVHGDLWSGNASVTAASEPVIFDPATYYGDREVDLAMTELFGRFPGSFYQGYNAIWPLDSGYELRKTLYNLYHIINHFNLFGGSYESQANRMISQLLSKV